MTTINDPGPGQLLSSPNYAIVATRNRNGSIHQTVVWVRAEGDEIEVNSAVGRLWPTNLERDPHVSVLVQETGDPYHFVEIRGRASGTLEGADAHIDALAKKYLGVDEYPNRRDDEQRIKFVIRPDHVRYVKMS